jgi:hypothetical protein
MKKVAKMLSDHLAGLLNFTLYPITNAVTEGFNSKIQSLKAAPRGFRYFLNYRIRIPFFCGRLDLCPSTRKIRLRTYFLRFEGRLISIAKRKRGFWRLQNQFASRLKGFRSRPIFRKPVIENHDRLQAGHNILLIDQLETLRAVSKIHPYLSMREQLDNDVKTKLVGITDSQHVFLDFAR